MILPRSFKVEIPAYTSWLKLQRIPAHELTLHEYGDSENQDVVFCVHGLTRNGRDFDLLARDLSKDFRVLSLDVVGRGNSDWFENKKHYNYNTYVKDVFALFDKLKLKNVRWIGTSMGGIIGMFIANKCPKLIRTLVINDIGPHIPGDPLRRMSRYVGLDPEFPSKEQAKIHLKRIFANFGITEEEHWDHLVDHSVKLTSSGQYKLAYDPNIAEGMNMKPNSKFKDVSFWKYWHNIHCPILVVRGSKSDILLEETLEQMLSSNLHAESYIVEGAGHAPSLMDEEQIHNIHDWIKRQR